MQELLALKGYVVEKDSQAVLVNKQNQSFEKLLEFARRGEIDRFSDQESIWRYFGPPVFETKVKVGEESYRVWMYRYSTKLFGPEKVYLYFDQNGKLKIYDFSPGGTLTPLIEVAHVQK